MSVRILVAEDDLTSRNVLTGILRKSAHDVIVTQNGAEAWELLQRPDAPRIAILDWMMPEIDGIGVCRRVRALETDRPPYIIMLTARDETLDIVAGLEAGADDYLAKPYAPEELLARIGVGQRFVELQARLADRMADLQTALDEVRSLHGIIPICMGCNKMRDDKGYWNRVEVYMRNHADIRFSHGLCPECIRTLYPDCADELQADAAG